jgi:hypothetical protein
MAWLHRELKKEEEALENIQAISLETKEENPPSISISEAIIMTKITLVISPCLDISQEYFGEVEKYTKGIGLKLLRQMDYNGQGIGKRRHVSYAPLYLQQVQA